MKGNRMFNPSTWLRSRSTTSKRSYVMADAHYLFGDHPKSQQLVQMSPATFLHLTMGPDKEWLLTDDRIAPLADRMETDAEIDPAYLEVDAWTRQVLAHEGRHRAAAARRLGLPTIPVILFLKQGRGYVDLDREPGLRIPDPETDLVPQRSVR